MANENGVLECPETIRSRGDAVQLWKHLLSQGISFHWEDDPANIIDVDTGERFFTASEAQKIGRLYDEVAALKDEWVYDAAVSLLKLTMFVDADVLRDLPLSACAAFERCASRSTARRILARVAPKRVHRRGSGVGR